MKRALSLILGLLVLLTLFNNGVSASSAVFLTFDSPDDALARVFDGDYVDTFAYTLPFTFDPAVDEFLIELDIYDCPDKMYLAGLLDPANNNLYDSIHWKIEYKDTQTISTPAGNIAVNLAGKDFHLRVENTPLSATESRLTILVTDLNTQEVLVNWTGTYDPNAYQASSKFAVAVWLSSSSIDAQGEIVDSMFHIYASDGLSTYLDNVYVGMVLFDVQVSLKDGLTGQSLTGVTVKDGNETLGTISDGGTLQLSRGTHTLTFEKSGYWSVTKTIDVQSDMSVSVEMYPSSTAFQFLNFPSDIQVYENSIYELTFTISPIDTSATYNTYLSLSGLSNILEVKKAGQVVSPESEKYYLGDISGDTQISIKFKAGSVGTHSFTITLTSNDALMSSTYTTSKQVAYNVIPLPFSVQMPSEWQVGTNELRVSESSGQTLLITALLKDSQGNEVWSDSTSLGPYEAYTFQVNVPSEGSYTLELQFNGQTASWDITVNPAIMLLTETVTASEGDIATVQVKINNPSSNTKYYTIVLEGPIIEGNVSKSVSVAPLSEKIVDVSFQVPKDLTYDAYDLNVKVYEGDALQFTDIVHLVIDSGGFSLPFLGGGSSSIDSTWIWIGAGVLALLVFVMALRRR